MVWLPDGEKKFDDVFSRFDRIPACDRQTDRRTNGQKDRQTPCDIAVHAVASRDENWQCHRHIETTYEVNVEALHFAAFINTVSERSNFHFSHSLKDPRVLITVVIRSHRQYIDEEYFLFITRSVNQLQLAADLRLAGVHRHCKKQRI